MSKKGVLTVISGFSGAGKGTIMKQLIEKYPYFLSISATTRKPREGEVNGREYYFHTREEFEHMIEQGELIEWAEYVGNYYGTPKQAVKDQLAEGKDVLLEIEMQGGMLVKEQFPEAVLIFITPPSYEELISKRLNRAGEEVAYMKSYDYLVVNDKLEDAVECVNQIIQNEHCRVCNCENLIEHMESELKNHSEGE